MSYKVFVKVYGESSYNTNMMAFATTEEAEAWARDLARRWVLVDTWEVRESDEPVNSRFVDNQLEAVN